MSLRRELEHHRHSLGEIREIMNSMKTLAYMETRKLARLIEAQQAVVTSMAGATARVMAGYPGVLPAMAPSVSAILLVGSERGFCGDFNHALLARLLPELDEDKGRITHLVAVGRKLNMLLEQDLYDGIFLEGASTADEIPAVLTRLTTGLSSLKQEGAFALHALYHSASGELVQRQLLPPFTGITPACGNAFPPVINLAPAPLLASLSEHYLFALLHAMLCGSLYAENHQRVTHMEGAVNHLDEEAERLKLRFNALRQEEITEEIEVILLNAANLEGGGCDR
ncbi:F0F1 ATP synthase subunit gamma [Oceanimonas baumannii]|uniref:F0F1 ATP synthase subunit gamma n=1 Tax=Oceanimonas baumannii TaxID=129578 RepID=UPI001D188B4D|nr:FoF1 ATP synthase subunit gamma [Oceanimonas baumannii]MCC4265059.1 F0F1 ATP synthase subunit gamma [Oceanimonas baumannii]